MEDRSNVFPTKNVEEFYNWLIMDFVSKQKSEGYVGYDQIRYVVLGKILENRKNGKKYFNLAKLIRETIKEERKKGNLPPEEWA